MAITGHIEVLALAPMAGVGEVHAGQVSHHLRAAFVTRLQFLLA